MKYANILYWPGAGFLVVPKTARVFLSLNLCSCCSLCLERSPLTPTGLTPSSPSGLGKCHLFELFPDHPIEKKSPISYSQTLLPLFILCIPPLDGSTRRVGRVFFFFLMFCFLHYPRFWEPRLGNWRCLISVGRMKGLYLRCHLSLGAPLISDWGRKTSSKGQKLPWSREGGTGTLWTRGSRAFKHMRITYLQVSGSYLQNLWSSKSGAEPNCAVFSNRLPFWCRGSPEHS